MTKIKTQEELFPHENFTWRLEINNKKDNKICWFECEYHAKKFISRHNMKKNEYSLSNKLSV
jgi:hypothetical protein